VDVARQLLAEGAEEILAGARMQGPVEGLQP
jgi:hypothetical protein